MSRTALRFEDSPSLGGATIVWQAIVLGGTLTATNAVVTVLF